MALFRCKDCFYFERYPDRPNGEKRSTGKCLKDPPVFLGADLGYGDPEIWEDRIRCRHFEELVPVCEPEGGTLKLNPVIRGLQKFIEDNNETGCGIHFCPACHQPQLSDHLMGTSVPEEHLPGCPYEV